MCTYECMCVLLCLFLQGGGAFHHFFQLFKNVCHSQTAQSHCCKLFLEDIACGGPASHYTTHWLLQCRIQIVKQLLLPSPWATAKGIVATDICTQPEAPHNIPKYPHERMTTNRDPTRFMSLIEILKILTFWSWRRPFKGHQVQYY